LDPLDFADPRIFDELNRIGLLAQDKEHRQCANMPHIESVDELERRLRENNFSKEHIDQVRLAWSQCSVPTFSRQGAYFQGAHFAKPDCVTFDNISLADCRFAKSNAGQARFQNVEWDRQPTYLWGSARRSVADERDAKTTEDFRATASLYKELAATCGARGLFDDARDFYFGEMEMNRLRKPRPMRYVSWEAWYFYLSGYGDRPVWALFWLVLAIFGLFPLLYLTTGVVHDPISALHRSLRASAFFEVPKDTDPLLATLVTAVQEIAVKVQACILGVSVKRMFWR
jgi:hypothetical protein